MHKRLKECSTVFHSLWRSETISSPFLTLPLSPDHAAGWQKSKWLIKSLRGTESDLVSPQCTTPSCYMLEPPIPIITESESDQRNSCLGMTVTSMLEYPQVALSLVVVVAPQTQRGLLLQKRSFEYKKASYITVPWNNFVQKKSVSMVKRGLI